MMNKNKKLIFLNIRTFLITNSIAVLLKPPLPCPELKENSMVFFNQIDPFALQLHKRL